MKRIIDPTFRYRASYATDIRKTFARVRRQQREAVAEQERREAQAAQKVAKLTRGAK